MYGSSLFNNCIAMYISNSNPPQNRPNKTDQNQLQNFKKSRKCLTGVATNQYFPKRQSNTKNNVVCYITKFKNFSLKLSAPTTLTRLNSIRKMWGKLLSPVPTTTAFAPV